MTERRINISMLVQQPPERVFAAWSSARALASWFAPMATQAPEVNMDFQVDGAYRIVMPLPDGSVHTTSGKFLEIVPNERIVMTWQCDAFADPETIVTVDFAKVSGGTQLRLTHDTFESPDTCTAHRGGWDACLSELARQLDAGDIAIAP